MDFLWPHSDRAAAMKRNKLDYTKPRPTLEQGNGAHTVAIAELSFQKQPWEPLEQARNRGDCECVQLPINTPTERVQHDITFIRKQLNVRKGNIGARYRITAGKVHGGASNVISALDA
ncbi:accessory gene regulator protein A [Striga asiatica]|uniref:Accessory gene regulator protein A n=1 Tax=Striga asiatica TaxID=4170 RepID=A0A5A7REF6_STRAF|nr:accessory gene regulator protein A [Striga asiatica]